MSRLADRTPQQKADLLCGLLLVADLQQKDLIEAGPFTVMADQVYASLALLVATESVVAPERPTAVEEALRLMRARGGLRAEDEEIVRFLLERADLEWP